MEKTNWKLNAGVNLDDDTDFGVYDRVNASGNTEIVYLSCCEVAVVELNRQLDVVSASEHTVAEFAQRAEELGLDGVSVIIPYSAGDNIYLIGIDEVGNVKGQNDIDASVIASDSISGEDYYALSEYDLEDMFLAEE